MASAFFRDAQGSYDPALNQIPMSVIDVADATVRGNVPTTWAAMTPAQDPTGYVFRQVDTGVYYIYNGTSFDAIGSGTDLFGSGTVDYLPVFTAANTVGNSHWKSTGTGLFPEDDATYQLGLAGKRITGGYFQNLYLDEIYDPTGTYRLIGYDTALPPLGGAVRVGQYDTASLRIYGLDIGLVASLSAGGSAQCVIDCDGGTIFSQLSGVGTELALAIEDRAGSPNRYLNFYAANTGSPGGELGMHFLLGANLYFGGTGGISMGGNKVTGSGAATAAGDVPQLQQLAGRLMVRI